MTRRFCRIPTLGIRCCCRTATLILRISASTLGVSYAVKPWMSAYSEVDNLLSQQRAGVLGYPAEPLNFRSGLRFVLGAR